MNMANLEDADQKPPTVPVAMAEKQLSSSFSRDKKLDSAILQFQKLKLSQMLEIQKLENSALEKKLSLRKEKQLSYDRILAKVNDSCEKLADDLEAQSIHVKDLVSSGIKPYNYDDSSCSSEDKFMECLKEVNPSESCLAHSSLDQTIERDKSCLKSANILCNVGSAVDDLWRMKGRLYDTELLALSENDCRQMASYGLATEVKSSQSTANNLLLKHISLGRELRMHQASDLKNKAELTYLRDDLKWTVCELEDCNQEISALKAKKDETKTSFLPVLSMESTFPGNHKSIDNPKELEVMESRLKELTDRSSSRLQELKHVHEERVEIVRKLSILQGALKNVKSISSSKASKMVIEELEKSKTDAIRFRSLYEKLQVEKDRVLWRERNTIVRNDVGDSFRRALTSAGSSIDELETNIEKQKDQMKKIEAMLEKAPRGPERTKIISNYQELVSSFPEGMSSMQSKLRMYKDTASDVHSLRAEIQTLSNVLARKANQLATLSRTSAEQDSEERSLQAMVEDLKEWDRDLKLFAEMYRRESVIPSDCLEARDKEYKAWARVDRLKSSLDEDNMVSRVKTAIKAEAISQQRLAVTESQITDLRDKCELSKRNKLKLSNDLKSKHDVNEAYLSEIESIGLAYNDLRNQNQQLLKQITEIDDYNIKLKMEDLRGKQNHGSLLMEKQILLKKIQEANVSRDVLEKNATQIEEQVESFAGQIQSLTEKRCQNRIALENIQKRKLEAGQSSRQARESLDALQLKVNNSRLNLSGLEIELDKERFEKRRAEEELQAVKRKVDHLKEQKESSNVGKLQLELQKYKDILKCSNCLDRPKEVVIMKCYHLVCSPCVQKVLKTRLRKCPVCAASFGPGDVKPVYL